LASRRSLIGWHSRSPVSELRCLHSCPPSARPSPRGLLSRRYAAPLAYVGGSMGTLVGADLLNLGAIQGLGAPVASIGGAGTLDGIFLTAILAVVDPGLSPAARAEESKAA